MNVWEKIKSEYSKGNSAIRQIIIINLGVFIFTILLGVFARLLVFDHKEVLSYFYLPSDLGTLISRPWSLITNIFFHDSNGIGHIFWNLITLYFIGRVLEDFLPPRKIWHIFFLGGLVGGVLFVMSYNLFPAFESSVATSKLLGASGGVTALIIAAGVHLPRYQVRLFGLFGVELRWIALVLFFGGLLSFPESDNAGGLIAHIGGAIVGALYILNLQGKIEFPKFEFKPRENVKMKKVPNSSSKPKKSDSLKPDQQEVDAILDKISSSGYDSLTKGEKDLLFKASE